MFRILAVLLALLTFGGIKELIHISNAPKYSSQQTSLIFIGAVITILMGFLSYYFWKKS